MAEENKWSFLTEEYVKNFCKPGKGKETCRYLTMGPDGWDCEKGTPMGQHIDEGVKANTIKAQGDNCPGVIGLLCEGKLVGDLKGKKVLHEESMPTYRVAGTIEELFVDKGMLCLKAKWDDGNDFAPATALGYLVIDNRGKKIVISATFPGGNTWTIDLS